MIKFLPLLFLLEITGFLLVLLFTWRYKAYFEYHRPYYSLHGRWIWFNICTALRPVLAVNLFVLVSAGWFWLLNYALKTAGLLS